MAENDTVTVEVTIRVEDLTEEQLYAARVLAERIAASAYNQVAAEHVAVIEEEKGNQIDTQISTAEAAGVLTRQREEDAVGTDPISVSAPSIEEVAGDVITLPTPVTEPAVVENVEPSESTDVDNPVEEDHEDAPAVEQEPVVEGEVQDPEDHTEYVPAAAEETPVEHVPDDPTNPDSEATHEVPVVDNVSASPETQVEAPEVDEAPDPAAEEENVSDKEEAPVEEAPVEEAPVETQDVVAAAEQAPDVDVVEAPAVVTEEEHQDA